MYKRVKLCWRITGDMKRNCNLECVLLIYLFKNCSSLRLLCFCFRYYKFSSVWLARPNHLVGHASTQVDDSWQLCNNRLCDVATDDIDIWFHRSLQVCVVMMNISLWFEHLTYTFTFKALTFNTSILHVCKLAKLHWYGSCASFFQRLALTGVCHYRTSEK